MKRSFDRSYALFSEGVIARAELWNKQTLLV